MTPDEFRKTGHELIEWVAAYMEGVDRFPVLSQVAPGETRAKLPTSPPEHGEQFEEIVADLDRVILPGITHWQSPRFFGFFPANASGPAILGDLISSGLGVQGMLWATSPRAPSWRPTYSTGWWRCSACPTGSARTRRVEA